MKEFVGFIEGTELTELFGPLSLAYNEYNLEYADSRDELRYFTTISSEIYPQLYDHYEAVYDDWVDEDEEDAE